MVSAFFRAAVGLTLLATEGEVSTIGEGWALGGIEFPISGAWEGTAAVTLGLGLDSHTGKGVIFRAMERQSQTLSAGLQATILSLREVEHSNGSSDAILAGPEALLGLQNGTRPLILTVGVLGGQLGEEPVMVSRFLVEFGF